MTVGKNHTITPTLSGLASLIKKFSMYPSGHPSVDSALSHQKMLFDNYFQSRPILEIGIGHDKLFIDDDEIRGDEWAESIIEALHEHSINQVAFLRGVSVSEILAFLEVLHVDPLMVRNRGGYGQLLAARGISKIRISEIDYKIASKDDEEGGEYFKDVDVWKKFAKGRKTQYENIQQNDIDLLNQLLSNAPKLSMILDSAMAGGVSKRDAQDAADVFFHVIALIRKEREKAGPGVVEDFAGQVESVLSVISPKSRYILLQQGANDKSKEVEKESFVKEFLVNLDDRSLARGILEGLNPENAVQKEFLKTYEYSLLSGKNCSDMS